MLYLIATLLLLCSCSSYKQESDAISWNDPLPTLPKEEMPHSQTTQSTHALYLMQSKSVEEAIDLLLEAKKQDAYAFHDGTLQKLGLLLLEQGSRSHDPQDIVSCLYGVGISQDAHALYILERALHFEDPQIQLVACKIIASFDTIEAELLLSQAMRSNYLFVRLEAAYYLALKKSPDAYNQIAALLSKLDPELHELFAYLFAIEGSRESQSELKHLLYHQLENVRREAILAIAETDQEIFLEDILKLSNEPSSVQQEAACFALGTFRNECARNELQRLSYSHNLAVALQANFALYRLGSHGAKEYIIEAAHRGNLFAIQLLGSIEGQEELLNELSEHPDIDVRINATIAQLMRRDSRCVPGLIEILIDTHKDYTYQQIVSHGGSMVAWKASSNSSELLANMPQFFELSLRLKEQALIASLELSEQDFLKIARAIFEYGQYDLIPLTIHLLENIQSEKVVAFFQEQEQRPGLPFVRAWSCLGLYRLHEPGPYAERVRKLVEKHEDIALFKARPVLPWRMRLDDPRHELSLEQSCALLIESFQALAEHQDEKGLEALLLAIRNGNPHNRYTLAGLLIRASL